MNRSTGWRGRSALARWTGALAAMIAGLGGLGAAAESQAQSLAPSEAPAQWVRYAEQATTVVSSWLEEDSEPAVAVRRYLDATRQASDQASPPLILKIWVDAEGVVERIDFTPFAHEAANNDLRSAIVGRALAGPPPRDMLLPMRIAVQLEPSEPSEPASVSEPARIATTPRTI